MSRLAPSRWQRFRPNTWSIRGKILTLLFLPILPLLAMWAFTTGVTLGPAVELRNAKIVIDDAGQPTGVLVHALQQERALAVVYQSSLPDTSQTAIALEAQQVQTDAVAGNLLRLTSSANFVGAEGTLTRTNLDTLRAALVKLPTQRAEMRSTGGPPSRAQVMVEYNRLIDDAFSVYGSIVNIDNYSLAEMAGTVIDLTGAGEQLAREDAVVQGSLATGKFTGADYTQFGAAVATQHYLADQAALHLTKTDQRTYQKLLASAPFAGLVAMENTILSKGPAAIGRAVPVDAALWRSDLYAASGQLELLTATTGQEAIDATGPAANSALDRLAVAGLVGIVVLVLLIVVSIRIARGMIKRIDRLRSDALALALQQLPDVVSRVRQGAEVDVEAEAPPLRYGTDELGQLGDALSRVQRTAIESAVQEATLRTGLNQVFLNISRRSQALLHRQLALLDGMERRTTDADELEDLFRVDHLSTRMRRHAEDLVILAGSTPSRGWRNPVALTDVLRAAASEVEQYARVAVRSFPDIALTGRSVGDVIHLVAELVENATHFSPPETEVTLSGQVVPHGFAIDIEDRGLGMTPEAIEGENARLLDPPDFDPANSSRLGLFVVAKLAAKQGIRVTLRPSAYGGVTAVVLIPTELLVDGRSAPKHAPVLESAPVERAAIGVGSHRAAAPAEAIGHPRNGAHPITPLTNGRRPGLSQVIGSHASTGPSDVARSDVVRADVARSDITRINAAGADETRIDETRTDETRTDSADASAALTSGPLTNEPPTGGTNVNGTNANGTGKNGAEPDGPPPEGLPPAAPQTATPQTTEGRVLTLLAPLTPRRRGTPIDGPPPIGPTSIGSASIGSAPTAPVSVGLTPDGLPQRVRGSRTIEPDAFAGDADRDVDHPDDADVNAATRTPEQMRSMLTSFQDGMNLGRRDAQVAAALTEHTAEIPTVPASTSAYPDEEGSTQ